MVKLIEAVMVESTATVLACRAWPLGECSRRSGADPVLGCSRPGPGVQLQVLVKTGTATSSERLLFKLAIRVACQFLQRTHPGSLSSPGPTVSSGATEDTQ